MAISKYNKYMTEEQIQGIILDYTTQLPDGTWEGCKTLARRYDTTTTTVLRHLELKGIPRRSQSEAHAGKACKPITNLPPEGEDPPLCKCSCGQHVEWSRSSNRWFAYVKGHYELKNRPYFDLEWLRTEYEDKHRSSIDIAKDLGVDALTVSRCLAQHGINVRTAGETLKLNGSVRGSKNPAWKGGIAKWSYTYNWKAIARAIRERDNYSCQLCGEYLKKTQHILHIHHIDEDKFNNSPYNLIALCSKCHHPLHGDLDIRSKLREIAVHNTEIAI